MGWGGVSPAPGSLQSLVLLSRLPFVRLFQALLGLVAPEFFDKLAPCLEAGEQPAGPAGPLRPPGYSPRRSAGQLPPGPASDTSRLCPQSLEPRQVQQEPGMPASSLGATGAAWTRPQQVPTSLHRFPLV